jgi:hypothetical protein
VHAPTHIGGRQIGWYDANGDMTQRVEISGTTAVTYTQGWDVYNRLTAVTNTVTLSVTQYCYNADGARMRRSASDGSTYYVGDLFELYVSATTTGSLTIYLDTDGSGDAPLILPPPMPEAGRKATVYLPVAMLSAADLMLSRISYETSATGDVYYLSCRFESYRIDARPKWFANINCWGMSR